MSPLLNRVQRRLRPQLEGRGSSSRLIDLEHQGLVDEDRGLIIPTENRDFFHFTVIIYKELTLFECDSQTSVFTH